MKQAYFKIKTLYNKKCGSKKTQIDTDLGQGEKYLFDQDKLKDEH